MNNSRSYFAFIVVLFLKFLSLVVADKNLGALSVTPSLIAVPENNGIWTLCSDTNTTFASYSVRVSNDSTSPLAAYGTTRPGIDTNVVNGPGFFVSLDDEPTREETGQSKKYDAQLSCYDNGNPKQSCDNDGAIEINSSYCVVILNPTALQQRASVAISFTNSVFQNPSVTSNETATPSDEPTPTDATSDNDKKSGLSPWFYVLIGVGAVVILGGVTAFICIRRRRRAAQDLYLDRPYTEHSDQPISQLNNLTYSPQPDDYETHERHPYRNSRYSFESQPSIPGSPQLGYISPSGRPTNEPRLGSPPPQPSPTTSPYLGPSVQMAQIDNLPTRITHESPNPPNRQLQTAYYPSSEPEPYSNTQRLTPSASQESFRDSREPEYNRTSPIPPLPPQQQQYLNPNPNPNTQTSPVFRFPSVRRPWRSAANTNPRNTPTDDESEFGGAY